MPRIVHEPWCEEHDEDGVFDHAGQCSTGDFCFGPVLKVPGFPDGPIGSLNGFRIGTEDVRVFIDYRTSSFGHLDTTAVRAIREAVAEDPDALLRALNLLIEALGPDIPPAREVPPESIAS